MSEPIMEPLYEQYRHAQLEQINQKNSNESKRSDPVDHPSHYNSHKSGVECITITRHMDFCTGNAIKYIWRHKDKGKPIEDLKKAIFYLKQQIEIYENENI